MPAENGIKANLKLSKSHGKHYVCLYMKSGNLSYNKSLGQLNENDPCSLLQLVIIASSQLRKIDELYALRMADKSWRFDLKIGRPAGKRQPGSWRQPETCRANASQDRGASHETYHSKTTARQAAQVKINFVRPLPPH